MTGTFYVNLDVNLDGNRAAAIAWFLNNQAQSEDGSFILKIEIDEDSISLALDGETFEKIEDQFVWEHPERYGAAGSDDGAPEEGEDGKD
jgi:hypothetical protein